MHNPCQRGARVGHWSNLCSPLLGYHVLFRERKNSSIYCAKCEARREKKLGDQRFPRKNEILKKKTSLHHLDNGGEVDDEFARGVSPSPSRMLQTVVPS